MLVVYMTSETQSRQFRKRCPPAMMPPDIYFFVAGIQALIDGSIFLLLASQITINMSLVLKKQYSSEHKKWTSVQYSQQSNKPILPLSSTQLAFRLPRSLTYLLTTVVIVSESLCNYLIPQISHCLNANNKFYKKPTLLDHVLGFLVRKNSLSLDNLYFTHISNSN